MHTYTDYHRHSGIKEAKNISDGINAVSPILDRFKEILEIESLIMKLSEKAYDEVTNSLMSDYIFSRKSKYGSIHQI